MGKGSALAPHEVAEGIRFGTGASLVDIDPGDTLLAPGDREHAVARTGELVTELTGLQERLYAEGVGGGHRSLLLLLQGMDTSGKDGTVRRVVGAMNPAGVTITSFKKPTSEELQHDFLWRIDKALPAPGDIGVFNRSQYEDVLVVRVHDLVPETEWSARYERINAGDLLERAFWDDYQVAYQDALSRCSTDAAPWYVVPADHKWYRDWLVANVLVSALRDLNPRYPPADFDVAEQRRLVAELD